MKTSRPVAPSALNVAMTSRRRSIWLLTALATPTPPTRSAARPTRVRNWVNRLMVRSSCGEALLRLRISQPASRQRASHLVDQRGGGAIVGRVVRQFYPIDPPDEAAGLQQSGRAQGGFADQESRTETDASGKLVRLGIDDAADLKTRAADADAVAELEIEPRQQRGIGRRAECAVTLGQQFVDRHLRLQRQFAEHRVGAIDRLELDQRQPAVGRARHRAQRRRHRQLLRGSAETPLHRAWLRAGSGRRRHRRQAACGLRAPVPR